MGFAISLRSDHPSAETVRALWRSVERFESRGSMASLGYPPHITLAIYDGEEPSEVACREAMRRAGRNTYAELISFDAIRTFDGPPLVLWAEPQPSEMLQTVHAAVHAVIDPAKCRSSYRPGAWVPHCTLGTQVKADRADAAAAFAREFRGRIDVTFDALDCVYFPPLAGVERLKLSTRR